MRAATAKWPYSGKDELNCLWARADVQATMMGRRGKREPVVLDMVRKAAAGSCGGVVAAANVSTRRRDRVRVQQGSDRVRSFVLACLLMMGREMEKRLS
jgi:hypothetical protein